MRVHFRNLAVTASIVLLSAWISSCGKKEAAVEAAVDDDNAIRIAASAIDLPKCAGAAEGKTYYVKDEAIFKYCDSSGQWSTIDLMGPKGADGAPGPTGPSGTSGGTFSVYDSGDANLGRLMFSDWPGVAISFSNGAFGGFSIATGEYDRGYCKSGFCSTDHGNWQFYLGSTISSTKSYCLFSSSDCSGNCILPDKPTGGALFMNAQNSFVSASGTEVASSEVTIHSLFRYNAGDYLITPAANAGDCVVTTGETIARSYSISVVSGSPYTFPTSINYPFSGPLQTR